MLKIVLFLSQVNALLGDVAPRSNHSKEQDEDLPKLLKMQILTLPIQISSRDFCVKIISESKCFEL